MTKVTPNISANDLAEVIKSNRTGFDYTASPTAITKYFERTLQKRISFATLILSMLMAGFAVSPYGHSFRFLPMFTAGDAQ